MDKFVLAIPENDAAKRERIIEDAVRLYPQYTREQITKEFDDVVNNDIVFVNDIYQVNARKLDRFYLGRTVIWLSIKRRDKAPIHDWRHLQAIKNELVGAECEAIELYPAESRVTDTANQYHLWVIADATFRFPFGFTQRLVSYVSTRDAKQRAKGE